MIKNKLDKCDNGLNRTLYNNLGKKALQSDFNSKIANDNKVIEFSNGIIRGLQALSQKVDPIISEFIKAEILPQIPNNITLNSQVSNLTIGN